MVLKEKVFGQPNIHIRNLKKYKKQTGSVKDVLQIYLTGAQSGLKAPNIVKESCN